MSVTYGFYDSLNHDRTYSTLQLSSIFDGIISDGIYATFLNALEVTASDPRSLNINVQPGRAWFNHTWTLNDSILLLTVAEPDVALPRIDTVVLEVNSNVNARENSIYIKTGTPSSSPVAPDLANGENGLYQYPLANIRVAKAADVETNGGIRQEDITNRRGTTDTPFVTGIIDTIDIDNLIAQWSSQFDTMFAELEVQISQAAQQQLVDGAVTTVKIANHAVSYDYTGTLNSNNWTSSNGAYTQTITLTCPAYQSNQLLTTDYFMADLDLSAVQSVSTMLEMIDGWGSILRCYCGSNNQLTFISERAIGLNIPIKAIGFRR